MPPTPPVDNYLEAIYVLQSYGQPVTTSKIAGRLGVAAPSVSAIVKRLVGQKLVRHAPYKEVRLTPAGEKAATPFCPPDLGGRIQLRSRHRLLNREVTTAVDPRRRVCLTGVVKAHVVQAPVRAERYWRFAGFERVVGSADLEPEVMFEGDHIHWLVDQPVVEPTAGAHDSHSHQTARDGCRARALGVSRNDHGPGSGHRLLPPDAGHAREASVSAIGDRV